MIPQPPDFLQLFAVEHRSREAVASAERLRKTLHRLAPASVPPRTGSAPVAQLRPARPCRPASGRTASRAA